MSTYLENFKGADIELQTLSDALPNLETALDHRLRLFFPQLPEDSCTDFLYINRESTPEPGQTPGLVSQSLSALIDECYLNQKVPTFNQGSEGVYHHDDSLEAQDKVWGMTLPQLEKYLEFTTYSLELCVRDALRDFWASPNAAFNAPSPKAWLSRFVLNLMRNEAHVRRADGTLSVEAMTVVHDTLPVAGTAVDITGKYGLYTLALNSQGSTTPVALYGAFVITTKDLPTVSDAPGDTHVVQDDTPRTVVLYTPSNGLEAFESLTLLNQEMAARLKDDYQRATLLDYVLVEDRPRALTHDRLVLSPVDADDAHTFYSEQVIEKQQRDMRHAWALARLEQEDASLEQRVELVEHILNTSLTIKPANLWRARNTRLIESKLPLWLKTASDADKISWRLAVERLNHERSVSQTPNAHPLNQIGQKSTLLGYARLQLKQQINTDHGIKVEPDSVFITTTEAVQTGPLINPVSSTGIGSGFAAGVSLSRTGPTISYITTRHSLSELALSNVGKLDLTFALTAQVKDAAGNTHPLLTRSYLKELVRRLDIGQRYKNLLNDLLVNSAQAKWRKERYVGFKKAQLTLDLLEARLSGNLAADEAAWVHTALETPLDTKRPRLNGAHIKAHLLMLRYKPLPGVMVFSSTGSHRLVCYMPDAPDNTWFLTANSRNELSQKLSQPSLRDYLLRRITPAQQAYIKPLMDKGLTDTTVSLQPINHDLFEASYDTEALHAIHDADEQSTSTWESNLNTAKETALTVIDIISIVLPTKVLLPVAMARFSYQIILGVDALRRDQHSEALLSFLDALTHLTDGASDFAGSAVFGSSIRQRAKQPTPTLSPNATSTPAMQDLTLRSAEKFGGGVYERSSAPNGQSDYFLKTGNNALFSSRYDNLDETWRVLDKRQPDALYSLPMRELSSGIWDVDPAHPQKTGIQRLIESTQVSGINLDSASADAHGIYRISNKRYIQEQGVVFEVFSSWLGRDVYLQLPSSSSHTADIRYKLRRIAGYWEIKHTLSSGAKHWEPLMRDTTGLSDAAPASTFSEYDAPIEHKAKIQRLIREQRGFLDTTGSSRNAEIAHLQNLFTELRFKLLDNARAFLRTNPVRARAIRPALPTNVSHAELFKRLLSHAEGLIFGETHSHQAGKKILINTMEVAAQHNVKVLYLEHLQTDLHQGLLDDFNKSGKMPVVLDDFLKAQDIGHRVDPNSPYNYSQLVRKAQRHGIEIIALDCMASYNPKGMRATPSGLETTSQHLIRYQTFSYHASTIIRAHQVKNAGKKWIALVGNTHANTFEGIPGLAELEGAIGIRVSDSAPGSGRGTRQDIVDVTPAGLRANEFLVLKNDYWLEVEIPGATPASPALTPAQLNDRIKHPGSFRFQSTGNEGALLIHRASNGEIVPTPIRTDPHGQFYIERESWGSAVHQKRYDVLEDLITDLRERGMTQVQ